MKIINVMLGRGLGGIEQAFLDYTQMLSKHAEVLSVTHSKAKILDELKKRGTPFKTISPLNNIDFIAVYKARKLIQLEKPSCIICHGGRAVAIFSKAARSICPVIALAHNYSLERLKQADAIFSITNDIKTKLVAANFPENRIFVIPNAIDTSLYRAGNKPFANPPVIGAIGRHVKKKGFEVFVKAVAILKQNGVSFKAIVAGDGEENTALKALAKSLGLSEFIEFPGWVQNKQQFFDSIDIFCLPSLHEPFGIVVLEAMAVGLPIVATRSEGPLEILEHEKDSLMVQVGDEKNMAEAISRMLENESHSTILAQNARIKATEKYDINPVSSAIYSSIKILLNKS